MANHRKPQKQKEMEGTARKDRDTGLKLPTAAPVQLNDMELLTDLEKAFMSDILGHLAEYEITSHLDKHAILMMADVYRIYREQREKIEVEGEVVEIVNNRGEVNLKEHPSVKIMFGAWDRLLKLMNEFGLTPNSRARLSAVKTEVDEMADMLSGR